MKTNRLIHVAISVLSFVMLAHDYVLAQENCIIKVTENDWGNFCRSTYVPTNETTRTAQATVEAFQHIFGGSCNWGYFLYESSPYPLYEGSCLGDDPCYGCGILAYQRMGMYFYDYVCQGGCFADFYKWNDPYFFRYSFNYGLWDVYCGPDSDGDGYPDSGDNCPGISNPDQADDDCDDIGNACQPTTTTTVPATTTTTSISTTTTTAEPVLVTLSSFTADTGREEILIRWSTASELDNAGFNIYRADSETGHYNKINTDLIPAKGSATQGAEYEFTDKDVRLWKTYFYQLEDVDLNGTATMHGPVSAMPRLLR